VQEGLPIAPVGRELSFAVAGVPIAQGSKTATIVGKRVPWGNTVAIVAPRVVLTDLADMHKKSRGSNALKKWRQNVAGRALIARRKAGFEMFTAAVTVDAEFVLPRADGHFVTSGALAKRAPLFPRRPDVSKLLRAIEDAMTGVVYVDDSQVTRAVVSKRYAIRGGSGGVMIRVREA
jgi:crossover junction endodeoxyribonuclease RusA